MRPVQTLIIYGYILLIVLHCRQDPTPSRCVPFKASIRFKPTCMHICAWSFLRLFAQLAGAPPRCQKNLCKLSVKHDSPNFHAHMMTITKIWCIWCGCTRFSCILCMQRVAAYFFCWGQKEEGKEANLSNTLLPEFTSNLYRLLRCLINQHLPYIFKETNQTSTYGNLYAYPCLVRFDHYASFIRFRY